MSGAAEILVGVEVVDPAGYATYRAEMAPLLAEQGGAFVIDARVAEVLRSPEPRRWNRVFTVRFPSQALLDGFFARPDYLAIRRHWFEPAVASTTTLGRYRIP